MLAFASLILEPFPMPTLLAAARSKSLAMACAATLALSACAGPAAYDDSLSPAQNQLRQANARFNQTVGEGAVAGAVLGGVAGLALGGRSRGQAAAIGAASGAALGAGAGYLVARNNLGRSSTEAQYADAISQASADAEAYRNSASASRQIADQASADAARLGAQLRSGQITQAQYRAGLAKYQADNDIITKQAADARQTASLLRQDARNASASNRNQLASTAADMEASQRELEQSRLRLSRALAGSA